MAEHLREQVDETACRRFEADWFAGGASALEDYLPPVDASNFMTTLEELVHIELELAWERAAAQTPSLAADSPTFQAPADVESYLARFPKLCRGDVLLRLVRQEYSVRRRVGQNPSLEEYRRRFPQLPLSEASFETRFLSHCREKTRISEMAAAAEVDLLTPQSRNFGGYELIEVIGRGGMGIVYRARQLEAGRDVALKVIRAEPADVHSPEEHHSIAERFRTEAQAAARLAHDNIVPVYDVGEIDGRCYYAMRLVEGESLAEAARAGPLENRRAAEYIEGAARAIHSAHRHGVLHRDVKPANILIDSQTDRPLVTDFGLAKLLQESQSVTRSGELIGTPSYMAPEQIDNATAAGADSDVYSLGATLYHLLTGRPPFQGVTLTETLWQVKQQEPAAPWLLNWGVDRDLDTICLKCLQKERSRRYESAEALADDLRRYLNNEPILARPIGPAEKARRWAMRNPVASRWVAVAAACALLLMVAIVAGYASTLSALAKAHRNFQHAQNAVNDLHTDVSESDLLHQPGLQPVRQKLLRRALDYYEIFLREQAGDRSVARELAAAAFRAGKITEELESPERALAYYERASEMQQKLASDHPGNLADLEALSDTLNARGAALRKLERLDEATADFEAAARLREKLAKRAPELAEYQRKLANSYMNLGIVAAARGDLAAARRHAAQGQTIRNRLLQTASEPRLLADSGKEHYNLAKLALVENRLADAERELQTAIARFRALGEASPEVLDHRSHLAACYRLLAQALCLAGDEPRRALALTAYHNALHTLESLANDNPRVVAYRAELAAVHQELGAVFTQGHDWDNALEAFTAARGILEPLSTAAPRYRRDFAVVLREMACAQIACEQIETARENLRQSLEHLEALTATFPRDSGYQSDFLETARLVKLLQEQPGE
jgi:tetratricopeptide (TPR) repeat protein/tRNA A-37 threonylcarbamoyl transferase component Bud32